MANNNLLAQAGPPFTSLGSEWTAVFGISKCQVVGGFTEPNAINTEAGQFYTGVVFPNDHVSECSINLVAANTNNFQLLVRFQTGVYSGYKAVVIGGSSSTVQVQIYRMDAGAATLLKTVTGAPIAALANGDIWTFSAFGSVLSVYQNFNQVAYIADDTYTGGSPGFLQFSSSAVASTQGVYWRGYGPIQQDGIWQKQGVIIRVRASDWASGGYGVWNPSNILYESGAQILSGTVYKMWHMRGGNSVGNPGKSYYTESLDGVTWAPSIQLLSNFGIQSLVKSGGIYYAFGQSGSTQGTGQVDVYTATDGVTFTLAASNVLSVGGGGAWDAGNIYVQCNPVLLNGTWYLLYGGGANPNSPFTLNSGIATATNLLGPWTKYAGNPVLSPAVSGPLIQVGNTFYTWTAVGPGANNIRISNDTFDPVETVRCSSTDMLNWSATRVRSLHHSQLYGNVNGVNGNATSSVLIDIGGLAHNYYIEAPNDAVDPRYYQISLALGPAIAQIVTQNEDAVAQTNTDAFPGGNGDLSGNWSTPAGGTKLTIVSNRVRATVVSSYNVMYYSGAAFSNDHYAEVTIPTLANTLSFAGPAVRVSGGSQSGYLAQTQGAFGALQTGGTAIVKMPSGTAIGPPATVTIHAGDVIRLTAVGPVISMYQNGALILQVEDTTYATGSPGMGIWSSVLANTEISLWAGGNSVLYITGNVGVAGATVSYTGTSSGSVVADSSGNYIIPNLLAGTYTITPSFPNYAFTPASQVANLASANLTVNFSARIPGGGGVAGGYRFTYGF